MLLQLTAGRMAAFSDVVTAVIITVIVIGSIITTWLMIHGQAGSNWRHSTSIVAVRGLAHFGIEHCVV